MQRCPGRVLLKKDTDGLQDRCVAKVWGTRSIKIRVHRPGSASFAAAPSNCSDGVVDCLSGWMLLIRSNFDPYSACAGKMELRP